MKHIVNFSGGKDSTAMLFQMIKDRKQIDMIVFADTGKEFPGLISHVQRVQDKIDIPITTITGKHSFDYLMFEKQKTRGTRMHERGYGWPGMLRRWCTRHLKIDPITKTIKDMFGDEPVTQYHGYAFDELKRFSKPRDTKNTTFRYPLVESRTTEPAALQQCYRMGFNWEGLYERFSRVSCWCCPLQGEKDLWLLYSFYPELWEELEEMDRKVIRRETWGTFKLGKGVQHYTNKFKAIG